MIVATQPTLRRLSTSNGCIIWQASNDEKEARVRCAIACQSSWISCRIRIRGTKSVPGEGSQLILAKVCGTGIGMQVVLDRDLAIFIFIADQAITPLIVMLDPERGGIPVFYLGTPV